MSSVTTRGDFTSGQNKTKVGLKGARGSRCINQSVSQNKTKVGLKELCTTLNNQFYPCQNKTKVGLKGGENDIK